MGDGEKYDEYTVRFSSKGTLGEDRYDAYKLFSLNSQSINLFSTLGKEVKLAVNVLPPLTEIEREVRIPLRYQLPHDGEYTFRWNQIEDLPRNVNVYLIDNKTGRKTNLRKGNAISFNYFKNTKRAFSGNNNPLLNRTKDVTTQPRFELLISFSKEIEKPESGMKKPVVLMPNYPNPFRNQTEMKFKLKEAGPVTMTIWNIVGQKVATIYRNKMMSAGEHEYYWNVAGDLPSGIYICKLEAAGTVVIRKMTLIK